MLTFPRRRQADNQYRGQEENRSGNEESLILLFLTYFLEFTVIARSVLPVPAFPKGDKLDVVIHQDIRRK